MVFLNRASEVPVPQFREVSGIVRHPADKKRNRTSPLPVGCHGTGRHANNPWLQELPDPVTKAVWENYAAISPRFALENGLEDYDVIEIRKKVSLPVLIQPGQAYGTISIALGYGRKNTGKVADGCGCECFSTGHCGFREYPV